MNVLLRSLAASAAAAAIGALSGCASTGYHFSQIYGERYNRAPIDTYPVLITRVDGQDNVFRPARVDPGLRHITVQGPPGAAERLGDEKSIDLQVAPCTRYYLVAQKANRLASDFNIVVDYQEPVAGCTPPAPR